MVWTKGKINVNFLHTAQFMQLIANCQFLHAPFTQYRLLHSTAGGQEKNQDSCIYVGRPHFAPSPDLPPHASSTPPTVCLRPGLGQLLRLPGAVLDLPQLRL